MSKLTSGTALYTVPIVGITEKREWDCQMRKSIIWGEVRKLLKENRDKREVRQTEAKTEYGWVRGSGINKENEKFPQTKQPHYRPQRTIILALSAAGIGEKAIDSTRSHAVERATLLSAVGRSTAAKKKMFDLL